MVIRDKPDDTTLVERYLVLGSRIDSCPRLSTEVPYENFLMCRYKLPQPPCDFPRFLSEGSGLLTELQCCATKHLTGSVVPHTATYILELLSCSRGKRHREHDAGFWQAYEEGWRKVVRCAPVTNLYALLPDFTVNARQPVFAKATDELSRKSTRS